MTPTEAPHLNRNLSDRRDLRSVQRVFTWRFPKQATTSGTESGSMALCDDAVGSHLGRRFRTVALVTLEIGLHALLKLLVVFPNR